MIRRTARCLGILAVGLYWTLAASPAAAVLQGDCNANSTVAINEVQRCANIFSTPARFSECPQCDQNGNGAVTINEVQGAANCFSNPAAMGCRMITPPAGGPTNTPVTPTSTPVTPTNTPQIIPTNTPVTPTSTPVTPTNTPVTPTNTPVTPTNTPVPPSATATATESSAGGFDVTLLPGLGACTGTCVGGSTNGNSCTGSFNCVSCTGTCVGGTKNGNSCAANANCPGGGACQNKVCVGGPNEGTTCANTTTCGGNCANRVCSDGPLKGDSCTSTPQCNGCALTPPQGSCANVQLPLFPLQLNLIGNLRLEVGDLQPDGTRPLRIPADSVYIQPVTVGTIGIACIGVAGDAVGFVDCDGGSSNLNIQLAQDHNTTPGSAGNYGQRCLGGTSAGRACTTDANCPGTNAICAGLVDDPSCTSRLISAVGTEDPACLEGLRFCLGGSSAGMVCTSDAQCPGSSCAPLMCRDGENGGMPCTTSAECPQSACGAFVCRGGSNASMPCVNDAGCPQGVCMPCSAASSHAGVCNSPVRVTQSGSFAPGDATILLPQTIQLIAANGTENGPDNMPCTADDTAGAAPAAVNVVLTTGTAAARVYDYDATNGNVIANQVNCGANPCLASFTGKPFSCAALTSGVFDGTLVGAFPALDTSSGDLVTTFQFVAKTE